MIKKGNKMKTKEEILNQVYMSAKDLKILIPTLGTNKCRRYIKELNQEMIEKKCFIPETKEYLALTKMVRKKFGF